MDYAALEKLVHDKPSDDLVSAISLRSDRHTLGLLLDAELERRRKQFELIEKYRSMLNAPAHTLPNELLSHIFFLTAVPALARRRALNASTVEFHRFTSTSVLGRRSTSTQANRITARACRIYCTSHTHAHSRRAVSNAVEETLDPYFWLSSPLASLHIAGTTSTALMKALDRMRNLSDHYHLTALTVLNLDVKSTSMIQIDEDLLLSRFCPRQLALLRAAFNIHSIHDLCSLKLMYHETDTLTFETDDILHALSRCPTIQSLHLKLPLGAHPPRTLGAQAISLLSLDDIHLEGTYVTCCALLTSLHLSPLARMTVYPLDEVAPHEASQLFLYLKARCEHADAPVLTALILDEMPYINLTFDLAFCTSTKPSSVSDSKRDDHGRKPADSTFVRFGLVAFTPEACVEVANAALPYFPLKNIKLLDIRRLYESPPELLQPFMQQIPALVTLAIDFYYPSFNDIVNGTLRPHLATRRRRPFRHLVLDAAEALERIGLTTGGWDPEECELEIEAIRERFVDVLKYCSEANKAGRPLDILEVINDGHPFDDPSTASFVLQVPLDQLWRDLAYGFIRNNEVLNRDGYWVDLGEE
ncbi:unnamed protein product [Peniophora sp. CBMAI 1063]|nr:unnamed protein product [Peniophora sp. CBMAI 1063]